MSESLPHPLGRGKRRTKPVRPRGLRLHIDVAFPDALRSRQNQSRRREIGANYLTSLPLDRGQACWTLLFLGQVVTRSDYKLSGMWITSLRSGSHVGAVATDNKQSRYRLPRFVLPRSKHMSTQSLNSVCNKKDFRAVCCHDSCQTERP